MGKSFSRIAQESFVNVPCPAWHPIEFSELEGEQAERERERDLTSYIKVLVILKQQSTISFNVTQ